MEQLIKLPRCHQILNQFQIGLILKNNISLHQQVPAEGGAGDLAVCIILLPSLNSLSLSFAFMKMAISMGISFQCSIASHSCCFRWTYSSNGSTPAGFSCGLGCSMGETPAPFIFLTGISLSLGLMASPEPSLMNKSSPCSEQRHPYGGPPGAPPSLGLCSDSSERKG